MVHVLRDVLRVVYWRPITLQGESMSKFDEFRKEFAKLDEEEKALVVFFLVMGLIMAVSLLVLIVVLVKELFVPALVVGAFYALGAIKWGWPVPKKIKQFFVK